jgi:hypothetical protein
LEGRLQAARAWERKPKPVVDEAAPVDPASAAQFIGRVEVMYRVARLAFQTDSTRSITLMQNGVATPVMHLKGVTINDGYHNLSHHGKSPDKLAQLEAIDEWQMRTLSALLGDLKSVEEGGESLLDRTMVLYGSNLGDANAHATTNMPILLAAAGSAMGSISSSIGPETILFPICSFRCCSGWGSKRTSSHRRRAQCAASS